jgi:hypothetical protein
MVVTKLEHVHWKQKKYINGTGKAMAEIKIYCQEEELKSK